MHSRYLTLLFCVAAIHLHAETTETTKTEPLKKNYIEAIATAETSNLLLYLNNRYIGSSDFGNVSLQSINDNFHSQWQWDQSVFSINEVGHPYQGSFYFTSGRANGLNFYESAALSMMGSATWELTCERSTPSLNDLITTTTGGTAFGEMFHRLYLEAIADNNPVIATLLSPTDAITNAINRRKPEKVEENLYELTLTNGFGFQMSQKGYPTPEDSHNMQSTANLASSHSLLVVYGDPFAHETQIPYSQFDMNVDLLFSPDLWQFAYFTDGFLISAPVADNSEKKATLGLTLNYDVILGSNNTFGATALDVSYKSRHIYGEQTNSTLKAHVGWLMLGSSQYYHPISEPLATGYEELNNYGTGINAKLYFALDNKTLGKEEFTAEAYHMWIIPNTAPKSEGSLTVLRAKISYSHQIGPNTMMGIANTSTMNFSRQKQLQDNTKLSNATIIFIQSDLKKQSDTTKIMTACSKGINNALKGINRSFKANRTNN